MSKKQLFVDKLAMQKINHIPNLALNYNYGNSNESKGKKRK